MRNDKIVTSEMELVEFINSYDYTGIQEFVCITANSNNVSDTSGSLNDSKEKVIEDAIVCYNTFYTTSTLEVSIIIDGITMSLTIDGPVKPEYEDKPETYEDTDIIEDTEIF